MSYIPEKLLKVTERPGDYWRDGLLYCGKCNTPRSCRIDLGGGERVVPSLCKCDRDNEAAEAEKERAKRVERLRERCLPLAEMRTARFERTNGTNCARRISACCFAAIPAQARAMRPCASQTSS